MDKRIIRNIIFLEKDRVSVIRHIGERIEFIKKDGEIDFPVTVDFWNWWEKALSYLPEDELDICFVYDKEYDLLFEEFYTMANKVSRDDSVWSLKYIKSFFWELKPTYFSVALIGKNQKEINLSGSTDKNASKKRFYTNLSFDEKDASVSTVNAIEETTSEEINEDNISPIAKYFIDLIRKERGY